MTVILLLLYFAIPCIYCTCFFPCVNYISLSFPFFRYVTDGLIMPLSLNSIKIPLMCVFLTYIVLPFSPSIHSRQILFPFCAGLGKNEMKKFLLLHC